MIKIIIRNLISNALKFTPQSGKIKINAINAETIIIIEVKDSGVGMNEEQIDKLFGVGSIKSTNGTDGEKGTGLGLLICSDLTKAIGGKIWAESLKSKGTSMKFSINKI